MVQIHLIGIGGVGMSALAQAYLDKGYSVSGSDRLLALGQRTPILEVLEAQGVKLAPQDGSGIASSTSAVIYSTAIESDNPDLVRAQTLQIPTKHRSEALAELTQGHELIAVTGTCGKSSVTAMLGHLLAGAGLDPFVINGAEMAGMPTNRIGSVRASKQAHGFMVVEADESDKSLMALSPTHVIVTNASGDHFPKDEALALFGAFKAKATGIVIDTCDSPNETFVPDGKWESTFEWRGRTWTLPMPGAHNIANAKVALAMALALGADEAKLAAALASFRGIRRRLERIGTFKGALVIDDYAHNIEKLAAAWQTLAAVCPAGVVGLWRPHGYAPLRKMMDGLAEMFNANVRPCDTLLLMPVYDAGGTATRDVNSEQLFAKLTCPAQMINTLDAAEQTMRALAGEGKALVTFGARDPGLPLLARKLAE